VESPRNNNKFVNKDRFFAKLATVQFANRGLNLHPAITLSFFVCLIAVWLSSSNAYDLAARVGQVKITLVWLLVVGTAAYINLFAMLCVSALGLTRKMPPLFVLTGISIVANLASAHVMLCAKMLLSLPMDLGWFTHLVEVFVKGVLPVGLFSCIYWKVVLRLPLSRPIVQEIPVEAHVNDKAQLYVDSQVIAEPAFLIKLPEKLRGEILCLRAEDHYLRVYTQYGDDLILYRFGDAVSQLSGGIQVHRSWWVALNAIDELQRENKRIHLKLHNGLIVPVSLTYQAKVKEVWKTADLIKAIN